MNGRIRQQTVLHSPSGNLLTHRNVTAGADLIPAPLNKRWPSTVAIAETAVPMTRANTMAALRMKGLPNSSISMIRPNTCGEF